MSCIPRNTPGEATEICQLHTIVSRNNFLLFGKSSGVTVRENNMMAGT